MKHVIIQQTSTRKMENCCYQLRNLVFIFDKCIQNWYDYVKNDEKPSQNVHFYTLYL